MKLIADCGWYSIVDDGSNSMYCVIKLDEYRMKFYGRKISPLMCYRYPNLCYLRLRRPHLTCFRCKLRRAVEGKYPLISRAYFKMILFNPDKNAFERAVFRILMTLAVFFG